jgi:hypothetical protein
MSKYVPGEYHLEFSNSADKKRANMIVSEILAQQGLNRRMKKSATVLILDTCELLTTFTLLKYHRKKMKHIIIVEKKKDRYAAIVLMLQIKKAGLSRGYCPKITVVNTDVFNYLHTCKEQIDFMWLDITKAHLSESDYDALEPKLKRLRCLAITIADRSGAGLSVRDRVNAMGARFSRELPNKVLDYGYRSCLDNGKLGQSMQVVAFGRIHAECKYRYTNVEYSEIPGFVRVTWAGYPNEKTIEPGNVSDWMIV